MFFETFSKSSNGEFGRLAEHFSDHTVTDKTSHMHKYSIKKDHPTVKLEDFEILNREFRQRKFKGKISEALFIK